MLMDRIDISDGNETLTDGQLMLFDGNISIHIITDEYSNNLENIKYISFAALVGDMKISEYVRLLNKPIKSASCNTNNGNIILNRIYKHFDSDDKDLGDLVYKYNNIFLKYSYSLEGTSNDDIIKITLTLLYSKSNFSYSSTVFDEIKSFLSKKDIDHEKAMNDFVVFLFSLKNRYSNTYNMHECVPSLKKTDIVVEFIKDKRSETFEHVDVRKFRVERPKEYLYISPSYILHKSQIDVNNPGLSLNLNSQLFPVMKGSETGSVDAQTQKIISTFFHSLRNIHDNDSKFQRLLKSYVFLSDNSFQVDVFFPSYLRYTVKLLYKEDYKLVCMALREHSQDVAKIILPTLHQHIIKYYIQMKNSEEFMKLQNSYYSYKFGFNIYDFTFKNRIYISKKKLDYFYLLIKLIVKLSGKITNVNDILNNFFDIIKAIDEKPVFFNRDFVCCIQLIGDIYGLVEDNSTERYKNEIVEVYACQITFIEYITSKITKKLQMSYKHDIDEKYIDFMMSDEIPSVFKSVLLLFIDKRESRMIKSYFGIYHNKKLMFYIKTFLSLLIKLKYSPMFDIFRKLSLDRSKKCEIEAASIRPDIPLYSIQRKKGIFIVEDQKINMYTPCLCTDPIHNSN